MNENTITYPTHNTVSLNDFINKEYSVQKEQARYMAANARTSIMMFKATKDARYLSRAKEEIQKGKDILNGFPRPLGVLFTEN